MRYTKVQEAADRFIISSDRFMAGFIVIMITLNINVPESERRQAEHNQNYVVMSSDKETDQYNVPWNTNVALWETLRTTVAQN